MKFSVYILYSNEADQHYIGHTKDVPNRLSQHITGRSKSTKKVSDWKLIYTKEFKTRAQAMKYEKKIKNKKSKKYIELLVRG